MRKSLLIKKSKTAELRFPVLRTDKTLVVFHNVSSGPFPSVCLHPQLVAADNCPFLSLVLPVKNVFFSSQCHQMLIHRLSTDFRGFLCIILRSLTYNIKRAECCCDSVLYENSWIELTYVMLCCSSHIEQPNVNFCTDLRFYLYNVYNVKIWVKCFVCLPVFVL